MAALSSGTELFAFEVEDQFASYGLVGVLIVRETEIVQFVMSCRVVGLDVEIAALATVICAIRASGNRPIAAAFAETDANLLCRDLFPSSGFVEQPGGWLLLGDSPAVPPHVRIDVDA